MNVSKIVLVSVKNVGASNCILSHNPILGKDSYVSTVRIAIYQNYCYYYFLYISNLQCTCVFNWLLLLSTRLQTPTDRAKCHKPEGTSKEGNPKKEKINRNEGKKDKNTII